MNIQMLDRAISGGFDAYRKLFQNKLLSYNKDDEGFLRFCALFCSWHASFVGGPPGLVAKISRGSDLFVDPLEPIQALKARNLFLASYLMDSIKEFWNHSEFEQRASHQCLQQAFLRGLIEASHIKSESINGICKEPEGLAAIKQHLARGFGYGMPDTQQSVFKALGFHLGSKTINGLEFKVLNEYFLSHHADLAHYLKAFQFKSTSGQFPAYAWLLLNAHTGEPGDSPHFKVALEGVNYALDLVKQGDVKKHDKMFDAVTAGFQSFVANKQMFLELG